MYKKFLFFAILAITGIIISSNVGAISNWTQMLTSSGDWGIWSTNKANTQELPTMIITKDGKVGVGLTKNSTISNSYYKPGDIIAKRICFENTEECHSSIANNLSNNISFNNTISGSLATEDTNGTIPYGTDKLKPFYIRINKDFLDKVGLDPNYGSGEFVGDQATNWFILGETDGLAYENVPKSLWIESGSNMGMLLKRERGHFDANNTNRRLSGCRYMGSNGILVDSTNLNFCSNPNNNIVTHTYCELDKKHCGILRLELRITTGTNTRDKNMGAQPQECYSESNSYNYMGQQSLKVVQWSDPEHVTIKNTPFKSPISNATYSPSWCSNYPGFMRMGVHGRFVLVDMYSIPSQSLTKYAEKYPAKIKVNKIGLTYLR